MNFKSVTDRIFKKPLPIKIQDNKHFNHKKFILITRGPVNNFKVQAEPNFRNFINIPQILSKKGHNCLTSPNQMERGVPEADVKKNNIKNLILEYARFRFLYNVINDSHMPVVEQPEDEEDSICNCFEEDAACSHI